MIRTEADHPFNHSNNEVLGKVSGGFPLSEEQCVCADCGCDLEHGDSVVAYCRITNPSITHRWSRMAYFCIDCDPSDLDDERLSEYRVGPNEVLVTGTLRSKGYRPWYPDDEEPNELRFQDNKWAEYAATRIEDRNTGPRSSPIITDVGEHQYNYAPSLHGKTIPVPSAVLSALIENTTLDGESDKTFPKSSDNPLRWAEALLAAHDTPCLEEQ